MRENKRVWANLGEVLQSGELVLVKLEWLDGPLLACLLSGVLMRINRGEILEFLVSKVVFARASDESLLFLLLCPVFHLVYPHNGRLFDLLGVLIIGWWDWTHLRVDESVAEEKLLAGVACVRVG